MKLYRWTIDEMAEQLKDSKAAVERTHQRVTRSLQSLQEFDVEVRKMVWILEKERVGLKG